MESETGEGMGMGKLKPSEGDRLEEIWGEGTSQKSWLGSSNKKWLGKIKQKPNQPTKQKMAFTFMIQGKEVTQVSGVDPVPAWGGLGNELDRRPPTPKAL